MSNGRSTVVGDVLCVLVVGESDVADAILDSLSAAVSGVSLIRERTIEGALERLDDRDVHCLVCPYVPPADRAAPSDSPLERIADRTDERPIIAVTDRRDAEAALEAGASDVVDRDASASVLTARVTNAAEGERYRLATSDGDRKRRAILESAAAVVWVLDADGDVEYASPAVEAQMGYTPAELERTSITRIVHPDDRESLRDTLASVAQAPVGTTERVSPRLGHADGTWHVSELTCTNRLADPSVEGIVVTRTGAMSAESAVSGDVRAGLDRLADGVLALGPRGEIRYANDPAGQLLADFAAPSGDEVSVGTVVWQLLPDDLGGQFADRIREARTTDSVVAFETTAPSLESPLTIAVHPGDDGVTVILSERSTAATVSTERDRLTLFESVVDALDDGVAVLDDSTIRLANPALATLAGTDELVGRPLEALFADDLATAVRERARSPVVRWMGPVTGELATETGRLVDVFVAPLPDPDRTLCVVRDRRGSSGAALATLSRTAATLRDAHTPSDVRSTVVDAVRETVDADVAAWYLPVDDGDGLRPAAVAAADRVTADDWGTIEPPPIEPDGTALSACLEDGTPTVFEAAALEDLLARTGLRAERVLAVPIAQRGVVLATSTEPMAFDGLDFDPLEALSETAVVALEGVDHAADLRSCRHARSRLETVAERVDRLRDAERSLLDADARETVERRLCEAVRSLTPLESTAEIELAWVGRVDEGRETVVPATWSGRDGEFLESTAFPLDRRAAGPTGIAATTREPAGIEDLAAGGSSDADGMRPWRQRPLERGFRSAFSVPLLSGEFRYGTLTAYADRPAAFDDRTRRACAHLAAVAGSAIGAIETRRALLANRITELEVVMRADAEPLSTIAHRVGDRIDVRAVIPRSSGGSTVFCGVSGLDSEAALESVRSVAAVETASIVGTGTGETVLEITVTEPTVARTVADRGGVVGSITPVDDRTRLVIELGEPIAVRPFVQALERTYSGTHLVARRERDRPTRTARPFDELGDHLSERQRRTLEAAYHSGFFEWPRERTGEEVAESLGISQPTFSRHLRLAQRKLFALLFEDAVGE
ncbi:bacterio-opsin activator domain-containing protein [Natrinema caseinilyticum]|uniref:bacterio-opsin activator domain-containing protein n=1 Tax=Natrinema caseinilyticum TaxID=2961570 RepID=UPI0020C52653|nr:bacterio-opsin activator domain-containing protein [Natrinema caseinilyticum]